MLSKENLVNVGYISRTHSFKGEIQITINKKIVPLKRGDFVFIRLEGQYIPYKIEATKGQVEEPVVQLEFIDNYDDAKALIGKEVFADVEAQPEESELSFIGYTLVDKHLGTIGKVKDVMELPQQTMMVVDYNEKECFVPLIEAFVNYIATGTKEIWVTLPQGILDI
jgi:16S rRNA processing protein RimM